VPERARMRTVLRMAHLLSKEDRESGAGEGIQIKCNFNFNSHFEVMIAMYGVASVVTKYLSGIAHSKLKHYYSFKAVLKLFNVVDSSFP
jgi:hypothetical protein